MAQIRPVLVKQIEQALQKQLQATNAQPINQMHFSDLSLTGYPPVGNPGTTVAVTLRVRGGVEYILTSDAQQLAGQLLVQLAQKLGANYALLDATIQIGQPVIEGLNSSGEATIKIAAGGVAQYQFPASELQAMRSYLKSRTLKDTRSFLARQTGVDTNTISIRFTSGSGDVLPDNPQQIKIVLFNPTTLPPVQLQAIPDPTATSAPPP
ncbi:MAG TPA: hypothetical protein VIZ18_18210 [Ktedonobacteraceae bacterium]